MNPARTFGPDLAAAIFGGDVKWGQSVVYWIGPLLGAMVAALLYDFVAETRAAGVAEDVASMPASDGDA